MPTNEFILARNRSNATNVGSDSVKRRIFGRIDSVTPTSDRTLASSAEKLFEAVKILPIIRSTMESGDSRVTPAGRRSLRLLTGTVTLPRFTKTKSLILAMSVENRLLRGVL